MEKSYDPSAIERRWYEHWESQQYFAPQGQGPAYCIMLPPPNVTGSLHMGHAFQDTIMDILTRYHRMSGHSTLWQPGTDHAGIATQMVVERRLAADGQSRHDLGREAFVEAVWDWKEQSGGTITRQMRHLGASVDWANERFTMDAGLSAAVTKVFVQLHEEGLIYRGKRLVNWDPVLRTALSDLEVLAEEENGKLWHICYPRKDGKGQMIVATTRPETMLGDVAVAVHPQDERYQDLIGQELELPLTGRTIPVIADEYVDPEFGTGCVKITPAHDFNDYEIGQRHELPMINVLHPDATLNENAPAEYRDLDRFVAREQIITELKEQGLLERIDEHKLVVPRGDRSGAVIEPFLTDQWYIKIAPLAEPAIKAVEDGRTRFVPENWSKTYFDWMHNIQDWCISRQLWWGHRIPAWYDEQENFYVGHDEADVRRRHNLPDNIRLRQDEDVLDTWFSSALWPFSTLGWPDETQRLQQFYPTSVLVTGFDIIFFWVARMMMMGLKFMGDVPFKEVYIHGLIRDAQGQKMSKSKGNVLDPLDLIHGIELEPLVEKRTQGLMQPQMAPAIERATRREFSQGIPAFGTDALRFTFAALATTGRDIRFDLGRIEGYRNFCNKLWNAARYVMLQTEQQTIDCAAARDNLDPIDRWITSRLQRTIEQTHTHLKTYRFDLAAQALYEFVWNEYCDWYLELSKPALRDGSATAQNSTRYTLLQVLEQILCLLHPIMPFITEEIWQRCTDKLEIEAATIMLRPYPKATDRDPQAETDIGWLQAVLQAVRRIRAELNIAPGRTLPILLQNGNSVDRRCSAEFGSMLQQVGKIEQIEWLQPDADSSQCAVALVGELKVLIPLAGLVDVEAELVRLGKLLEKEKQDLKRSNGKLKNENFVNNAPAAVVAQEQARLAKHQSTIESLRIQMEKMEKLQN